MPNFFKRGTVDLDMAGSSTTACRVRHGVAQGVANATSLAVTFDTEMFDTHGFFDPAAPTRLTIPAGQGGLYEVGAQVRFAANTAGRRQLGIHRSGLEYVTLDSVAATGAGPATVLSTGLVPLAAGDYLIAYAYHDSGQASLDLETGNGSPTLWVHKVGVL